MQNVKVSRDGNKLTLVVELDKPVGMSKSGKNMLLGTTGGTHKVTVDGKTIHIGLNVWTEPKAAAI